MSIVDKFLDELNNRIQAVSAEIIDINTYRNNALELGNVLFSKNINRNDLLAGGNVAALAIDALSIDEFSKMRTLIGSECDLGSLEDFLDNKSVFKLYHNIKSKYGDIATADQYINAINYFSHLGKSIADYINEHTSEATSRLKTNIDTVGILKRYMGMFRAGVLVEPILDFQKFHKVVDLSSLSVAEKAQVKKIVGQSSFHLVMNQQFERAFLEPVQKYRDYVQKQTKKLKEQLEQIKKFVAINKISNINTENASEKFSFISDANSEITYRNVKTSVICLLLMSELQSFDTVIKSDINDNDRKSYLIRTIQNAEEILALQGVKQIKKPKKAKEITPKPVETRLMVVEPQPVMKVEETKLTAVSEEVLEPIVEEPLIEDKKPEVTIVIDEKVQAADDVEPTANRMEIDDFSVDQELAKVFTAVNGKAIATQIARVTRKAEEKKKIEKENAEDQSLTIESAVEETKEKIAVEPVISKEMIPEAKEIINYIETILKDENGYLQSIYPGNEPQDHYERFTKLLALVNENDNPDDKIRTAAIVETLRQELDAFRILAVKYSSSPEDFKDEYEAKMKNVQGYLEIYDVLKKRSNKKNQSVNQALYLSNDNGQMLLLDYTDSLTSAQKKIAKAMHDDILKSKFKNINTQKVTEVNCQDKVYDVISATRKNVIIPYIELSDTILFLAFLAKKENVNQSVKDIVEMNYERVNDIILKSDSVQEREMLYAEQANIRSSLTDYFGEVVKSK